MRVILNGELRKFSILIKKNQHRICMYKCDWAVAQTH